MNQPVAPCKLMVPIGKTALVIKAIIFLTFLREKNLLEK
jgi:hypothetical protein